MPNKNLSPVPNTLNPRKLGAGVGIRTPHAGPQDFDRPRRRPRGRTMATMLVSGARGRRKGYDSHKKNRLSRTRSPQCNRRGGTPRLRNNEAQATTRRRGPWQCRKSRKLYGTERGWITAETALSFQRGVTSSWRTTLNWLPVHHGLPEFTCKRHGSYIAPQRSPSCGHRHSRDEPGTERWGWHDYYASSKPENLRSCANALT